MLALVGRMAWPGWAGSDGTGRAAFCSRLIAMSSRRCSRCRKVHDEFGKAHKPRVRVSLPASLARTVPPARRKVLSSDVFFFAFILFSYVFVKIFFDNSKIL